MNRVAITGLGCISALGHSVEAFWDSLVNGRSGIAQTSLVPPEKLNIKISAEVKDYDRERHFDERQLPLLDRFSEFALLATREAIADAGLDFGGALGRRTAVIVGTGVGGMTTIDNAFERLYQDGVPRIHPFTIPRLMVSAAPSHITMDVGITGPSYAVSSACSSANHAIGDAFTMIRNGRADAAVTGGTDACITLGTLRAWESLRVMAPDTCRPFCADRKGMVLGEGAGIMVLERLDAAERRGAKIYAELVGFGMSADAGDIVMPSLDGAAAAIAMALEDGGLNPEDITYVNAHGTATGANDPTETGAIKKVFGAQAHELAVSSTKSMHGHTLGAAGALELIATLKAIDEGALPPTANFTEADPECDLDYVPNEARDARIKSAISNSFAFGGLNAVLAVTRHR